MDEWISSLFATNREREGVVVGGVLKFGST